MSDERIRRRGVFLFAMVLLLSAGLVRAQPAAQAQPTGAKAILKSMSDWMGSQKSLELTFDSDIEIITPQLEKIQFANTGTMLLVRPDKIKAHRFGGYADVELFSAAAPQYTVRIRSWKTGATPAAGTFTFVPPAGAKKLPPGALVDLDELPQGLPLGFAEVRFDAGSGPPPSFLGARAGPGTGAPRGPLSVVPPGNEPGESRQNATPSWNVRADLPPSPLPYAT